jgi:dTDP-4-amino-4,6-dideoxygalactose transaminase
MTPRRVSIAQPATGVEEWEALRAPLETGWLTQGPQVAEFERLFAARHEVGHALATTSCTTALHLALAALGVGPGDEVIVPAFTWVATANAVLYCGARPVFADVEEATGNIDPKDVERLVTSRTRAVIPVHLFGLCADMDALREAAPSPVAMVEDAACAVGAALHGRPAGGLGDLAAFSFHPRKIVTTGEGGMLTTDDDDLAERAEVLRNHGASVSEEMRHAGPTPYLLPDFEELGFNYRMSDLQGAVGVVQLARLDALLAERRRWADWYTSTLADLEWLRTPVVPPGWDHSWQSYVCVVDEQVAPAPRDRLMERLQELGVATRPGTHTVTELGYYRRVVGVEPGSCPVAAQLEATTMAIPLHNRMDDEDFAYVAECLHGL